MARAHFVKKARKAIPSAKIAVGDSYWHWTFRNRYGKGSRHVSKEKPKRQQLTRSDFAIAVYDIEDALAELSPDSSLEENVQQIAEQLRELGQEQESKRDGMPEGLQNAPTGELLQERADACEESASNLESVDFDAWEEDAELTAEARKADADAEAVNADGETEEDHWQAILEEVQGVEMPSA